MNSVVLPLLSFNHREDYKRRNVIKICRAFVDNKIKTKSREIMILFSSKTNYANGLNIIRLDEFENEDKLKTRSCEIMIILKNHIQNIIKIFL